MIAVYCVQLEPTVYSHVLHCAGGVELRCCVVHCHGLGDDDVVGATVVVVDGVSVEVVAASVDVVVLSVEVVVPADEVVPPEVEELVLVSSKSTVVSFHPGCGCAIAKFIHPNVLQTANKTINCLFAIS